MQHFKGKNNLNFLEIGAAEGRSANYFVDNSSNRSNLRNMVQSLNNKWKKRYGLIGVG